MGAASVLVRGIGLLLAAGAGASTRAGLLAAGALVGGAGFLLAAKIRAGAGIAGNLFVQQLEIDLLEGFALISNRLGNRGLDGGAAGRQTGGGSGRTGQQGAGAQQRDGFVFHDVFLLFSMVFGGEGTPCLLVYTKELQNGNKTYWKPDYMAEMMRFNGEIA